MDLGNGLHCPHNTLTMEDSSGIAVDPWLLARDRYLEDLSDDEKALFENATIENIFYSASAAQKRHEADSKTRLAARKLKPFVAALEQYGKALDIYANASSTIMCPLWGSIRVLLQLAGAFEKYFGKLLDMFSRIGDVLPQFQVYAR
ncbi:MAG: nacht domain [Lasallia pustulata]|uniref:Nacht domain n=1 Tax=Lasallia pustulata TaxID=136370 RepID=A0A5M8PRB0_9LECA|nr:MAG: nacht domain [Lasallia pustulata]